AHLRLTDFMDLPSLQEIQDSFAAIANVKARITEAEGNLLTQPTPTKELLRRQRAIEEAEESNGEEVAAVEASANLPVSPSRGGRFGQRAAKNGGGGLRGDECQGLVDSAHRSC